MHTALCVIALEAAGVSPQLLNDYIDQFKFPSGLAPYGVFEKKRWLSSKTAGHLKCDASDGLSLIVVIANFFQRLLDTPATGAEARRHCSCYLALAKVVVLIVRNPRRLADQASLRRLYGEQRMVPKFHYLLHLADHPILFSCFVLERKHKTIKRFQNELRNCGSAYASNILRSVTNNQVGHVRQLPAEH